MSISSGSDEACLKLRMALPRPPPISGRRLAPNRRMRLSGDETASVVRAALLHDFFGYDWRGDVFRRYLHRYSGIQRIMRMHAFVHGHIAAERAKCVFGLSDEECEAIARHMFPLAAIPRTRIAWIVTLADKVVASREMAAAVGGYLFPSRRRALPEA